MYLPKGLCGKGSLAASPERVVHRRVHLVALEELVVPSSQGENWMPPAPHCLQVFHLVQP